MLPTTFDGMCDGDGDRDDEALGMSACRCGTRREVERGGKVFSLLLRESTRKL